MIALSIYKFKFQKVLEYRKSMENQKKYILSMHTKKYLNEKEDLDKLSHNLQSSNDVLIEKVNNGITIDKLRNMSEEQEFYREGIKKKTYTLMKAKEDVKQGRYELMKAMQNKKIMERLKEIHYDEFQYDEKRKDEKHLEEIVSFKVSEK